MNFKHIIILIVLTLILMLSSYELLEGIYHHFSVTIISLLILVILADIIIMTKTYLKYMKSAQQDK